LGSSPHTQTFKPLEKKVKPSKKTFWRRFCSHRPIANNKA